MGRTSQFDKLRKKRRRKRLFRRTVAAAVLAALAAAAVFAVTVVYQLDLRSQLENYAASLRGGGGFPVALDGMTVHRLLPMGKDVAVVTSAGTYIYNSSGARINSCLNNYRTPQARAAGGKILTYDLGGADLRVDNKAKQLHALTVKGGSLLAADIAQNGAIAVAQTGVGVDAMVLAYNPELKKKEEVPNSFHDFAYNEAVKGKISMSNPLTSGTAMAAVTALKDKYGYEYFEALGKQNVMVESGGVACTKLETGECDVIMILEESILKKREEDDSALEVIYPTDGTIVIPSTIMTIADGKNANNNIAACQAITDWFLSNEGQKNIVAGWMHSVVSGYPEPPYDAIPTSEILKNTMPVNWENCFRQRDEIRTKFQESVTIPESK